MKLSNLWKQEFGAEYEVPSELCDLSRYNDFSWHNDISPSFCLARDQEGLLRLWVEHPDPKQREHGGVRFTVYFNNDDPAKCREFYAGDDLQAAVKALHDAGAELMPDTQN